MINTKSKKSPTFHLQINTKPKCWIILWFISFDDTNTDTRRQGMKVYHTFNLFLIGQCTFLPANHRSKYASQSLFNLQFVIDSKLAIFDQIIQHNKSKIFWRTFSRCMNRLRNNFNEVNKKNTKNNTIDIMSKDNSMNEILYDYTLGKNDSWEKKRN